MVPGHDLILDNVKDCVVDRPIAAQEQGWSQALPQTGPALLLRLCDFQRQILSVNFKITNIGIIPAVLKSLMTT